MSDYIKHKEYKLPNGRTVTADFNELGEARVTIEAMDCLMDMINSLVEVVRCKDCEYWDEHERCDFWSSLMSPHYPGKNDFCSYAERAEVNHENI